MSHATERTRLLSNEIKPQYVFDSTITRERQRRIKQFQCCLCVIFISTLIIAFVTTIAYSISKSNNEIHNITNSTNTPSDIIVALLTNSWPLPDQRQKEKICNNETEWNNAMAEGQRALDLKNEIAKNNTPLPVNSPSYKHQKVVATSAKARMLAELGYKEEFARRYFPKNTSRICNKNKTKILEHCNHTTSKCNVLQKFRTYNGTCNNLKHPTEFGVAYQPFRRALPPDYADGISKPRVGVNGNPLPSARTVSLEVHRPYFKDDDKFSVVLAVWGQFLDHDMTATALNQGVNGTSISCCLDNQTVHPECFPIKIDPFDPYARYNVTCMEFIRSAPAPTCCLSPREQMNQVTSFIDGSVIYGVDDDTVIELRTMQGGELLMYTTEDNRTLLPISTDLNDGCNRKTESDQGRYCFLTGPDLMEKFNLYPQSSNYFTRYDDSINPSIANNFATAAFRFAHSIIPSLMKFLAKDSSSLEFIQLHKMLFDPFKMYQPGELDRALRGAMDTTIEANDPYFSHELKQHLFEGDSDKKVKLCGLDLVSLNIQRGRDHGLVGYNSWREHCGLRRGCTFEQLRGDIDDDSLRNIQSVYRNVEDIDLYTGILSEKPMNGSILGPTLACLILDQFIRVKNGDRFWYESPNWFTLKQLDEVRKTSLAKIICDNSDNVDTVQPLVMEKIRNDNQLTNCNILPEPNWNSWKEKSARVKISDDDKISIKTYTKESEVRVMVS
ncbi:peroxidase, partial [Asbolus verrucosus]